MPQLPELPPHQFWQIDEARQIVTQFSGYNSQDLFKKVLVIKLMVNDTEPAHEKSFLGLFKRTVPEKSEPIMLSSAVLSRRHNPNVDDDGFPVPTDESVARAAQEALDLWKTAVRKQDELNTAFRKYIGNYPPKRLG
jgi:hypothetical protein